MEILTITEASPAVGHLYAIREENYQNKLDEKRVMEFRYAVAKILFACPRARKDIQTAVSFLTTRVRIPDEENWDKLKRVLCYVWQK